MSDATITMAPIYRRPAVNGDEQDAFSKASRRVVIAFSRPGVARKTKARHNRRERQAVRRALRDYTAA